MLIKVGDWVKQVKYLDPKEHPFCKISSITKKIKGFTVYHKHLNKERNSNIDINSLNTKLFKRLNAEEKAMVALYLCSKTLDK